MFRRAFGLILACSIEIAQTAPRTCISLDGERTSPSTKVAFPLQGTFEGEKLVLAGVGTRVKAFVVTVYTVAFYAKKKTLLAASDVKGNVAKEILASKSGACTLNFYMSVGPKKVAEALAAVSGVDQQILSQFQQKLNDAIGEENMAPGQEISLVWKDDGTLVVTVRKHSTFQFKNKELAEGLLRMYVGKEAVSPSLIQDMEAWNQKISETLHSC